MHWITYFTLKFREKAIQGICAVPLKFVVISKLLLKISREVCKFSMNTSSIMRESPCFNRQAAWSMLQMINNKSFEIPTKWAGPAAAKAQLSSRSTSRTSLPMKKVGGDLHLSVGFWCFLQSRMAMTTAMMSSTRHADTIDTIRIVDALLISFNSPIPATTIENLLTKGKHGYYHIHILM